MPRRHAFALLNATHVRQQADHALRIAGLAGLIPLRTLNRAACAPYHNAYHADCLVVQCAEAIRFYAAERCWLDGPALLAAAFFHDFNHTAGEFDDDVNIARACDAVQQLLPGAVGDDVSVSVVCDLIRPTRYPFAPTDPECIEARVLRDADLMQVLECVETVRLAQYDGLRVEVARREGQELTRPAFAEGMRAWWQVHTRWLSAWGVQRATALRFEDRCMDTAATLERGCNAGEVIHAASGAR